MRPLDLREDAVADRTGDAALKKLGHGQGKRTFPRCFFEKNGKGLNLKTLLDDPPEEFVNDFPRNLPDKYFSKDQDVNLRVLLAVFELFGDTTAVAYAAWFN